MRKINGIFQHHSKGCQGTEEEALLFFKKSLNKTHRLSKVDIFILKIIFLLTDKKELSKEFHVEVTTNI